MSDKAKELLTKARTRLITEDCPYWGVLCMGMDIIETEDQSKTLGTMATDGKAIYYDPAFVESLSLPELEFCLAHESGVHKGLLHPIRLREMGANTNLKIFNEAADYVGNLILANANIGKLPKDILYNTKFAEMSVEQVYKILMKEEEEKEKEKQLLPLDRQGEDQSKKQEQPEDTEDQLRQAEKEQEQNKKEKSQTRNDPAKCGGVIPAPEFTETDLKEGEEEAKSEVRKALQAAKKAGHIPEGLREMVEELLEPKTDWRSLLRQYMEERSKNDYTWNRPNKRYLPTGLYMPQLDSHELGEVVELIDRSGSVNDEQGQKLITEGLSILETYPGSTLQVIFFATKATDPIEIIEQAQIKEIKPTNVGYGTDYIPPFGKIQEAGLNPVIIIVLTDGYCGSFPTYPDAPVLWLINNKDEFHPPFGDVIRMIE